MYSILVKDARCPRVRCLLRSLARPANDGGKLYVCAVRSDVWLEPPYLSFVFWEPMLDAVSNQFRRPYAVAACISTHRSIMLHPTHTRTRHTHTHTHSTKRTASKALQFYGRCDAVCRPPPVHPVIDAVIDAEAVRRPPPVHPVIDAVDNAQAAEGKEAAQQYTNQDVCTTSNQIYAQGAR